MTTRTIHIYATLPVTGVDCPWCGAPTWTITLRTAGIVAACPACARQLLAPPGPATSPLARALAGYQDAVLARLAAAGAPPALCQEIAETAALLPPLPAATFVGGQLLVHVGWHRPGGAPQLPQVRAEAGVLHALLAAYLGPILVPESIVGADPDPRTPSEGGVSWTP